ncbi:MAG: YciI family protein [Dehalococcoidia bacterium]
MHYVLLMYGEEAKGETPTQMPAERAAEWATFWQEQPLKSVLHSWGALMPTAVARTMRVDEPPTPVVTDGPFAETKEQLGGFIIVECDSMDEALEFAAQVPCGPHGSIEVRALSDLG